MPKPSKSALIALLTAGLAHSPAHAGSETVIYSFQAPADGAGPFSALTAADGMLFGASQHGGPFGCDAIEDYCGTIYSVTPGGVKTILHAFTGGSEGDRPAFAPTVKNHVLYGTTQFGGTSGSCGSVGCGTAYTMTEAGALTTTHQFGNPPDGATPTGPLTQVGPTWYGTAYGGGNRNRGTIFAIGPAGYSTIYAFPGIGYKGTAPQYDLVPLNGLLYGTTASTGPRGRTGLIFSVTKRGVEKPVYTFKGGTDGTSPNGLLLVKGAFYGTTSEGGANNRGTVYRVTPDGAETILHSFGGTGDGYGPTGTLCNVAGTLYGTTPFGGAAGNGTIFSITLDGTETVVYSFGAVPDAQIPEAGLVAMGGKLYGVGTYGGTQGHGAIFSFAP